MTDCTGLTSSSSGITLINDVVPTFESDVPGAWASDLYTARTSQNSYTLGFQFDIICIARSGTLFISLSNLEYSSTRLDNQCLSLPRLSSPNWTSSTW